VLAVAGAVVAMGLAPAMAQAPQGGGQGAPGAPAGGRQGGGGAGRGPQTPPLLLTSTAWEDGGVIPNKFTQAAEGGMAVSPELKWSQVPMGTQSFVLLVHDPEPVLNKGSKMDITHWLIWNIPGRPPACPKVSRRASCPTAAVRSACVRTRTWGWARPPARITTTRSSVRARHQAGRAAGHAGAGGRHRTAVVNAMDGHVLGKAVLVARFHR
jgi:phosphatidylethanolamine-binding protein (PEBP) family uncharacterized protein